MEGTVYIPAAAITVLMLGPGTEITHRAMELIGDTGISVVWIGEHGVLAASVITAFGCSAGLGFIHVGHEFSFAYDIADLYKAETTISLAFQLAGEEVPDIANVIRRRLRDVFARTHLLEKMVSFSPHTRG